MVVATQFGHVVDIGGAIMVPFVDVVGVAPRGRPVAAGEDASAVADHECPPLVAVGVPKGTSHAEWVARGGNLHRADHAGGNDEAKDLG